MNETEVRRLFRKEVKEAGGQRAYARKVGLSATYINHVFHGHLPIGPKLLKALGLKATARVEYEMVKPAKDGHVNKS